MSGENQSVKTTEKKPNRLRKNWRSFLMLVIIFWIGFEFGHVNAIKNNSEQVVPLKDAQIENTQKEQEIDFSLFWEVWDLLKEKYVDADSLDAKNLLYGSIDGMLKATGDPYTTFFDPKETQEFNEEIEGSFEGIGAEIGMKDEILTIIAPLKGAPAEIAGLRAGDKVLAIDGKSTQDMTIDSAIDLIRGPKGSEVVLTIYREGEEGTLDISIRRDVINIKSVEFEKKDGDILYISLSLFGEDTVKEFNAALKEVYKENVKGIVLDLRNNPGGYLDGAISVAERMLPKGKTVVIEEDAQGKRNETYASGLDVASQIETVVLINEGSASASEIVAGALKENRDNLTLVGKKSFGKGSVQQLIDLGDNMAVKITVAHWLTPHGNQINGKGIEPDEDVDLTLDDYKNKKDPQLDRALDILKNKIQK